MNELDEIIKQINQFRVDRDWKQFHNPKNLAISLSLEANEVLEHFQWKTPEESRNLSQEKKAQLQQEIADVAVYLLYLCDELGIDLIDAIKEKIQINNDKYPVAKSKGKSTKYNELK